MKTRLKILASLGVVGAVLYGLSWCYYFLNQPDNLLVVLGVFGIASVLLVAPTILYHIWRNHDKETA